MALCDLNSKGSMMSANELDAIHKILSGMCKIEEIEAMEDQRYSSSWGISHANVHYPTIQGMPSFGYQDRSYGIQNENKMLRDTGHAGHSIKDRMIANLENMMGMAQNDYERQEILEEIKAIQNKERR